MPSRRRRWVGAVGAVVLAVVVVTVGGTWAAWTDSVAVGGTSVTGGTLDVTVDGTNSVTTSSLSLPAMVPGSTSAQVLTVRNAGTAPLKYAVTASLTGGGAGVLSTSTSMRLTVVKDATRATGVTGATCSGGTPLASAVALTDVAGTTAVPLRGPLAPGSSESVCVQLTLALDAPSLLQGVSAGVGLAVTATSDVS